MRGRSLQIAWRAEDTDATPKAAYCAEPNRPVREILALAVGPGCPRERIQNHGTG